jgi:hypothetical protein
MTVHDVGRSVGRGARATLRKLSFVVFNPDRTPPRAALDGTEIGALFRRSWRLRNGPRQSQRPRGVQVTGVQASAPGPAKTPENLETSAASQRVWRRRPERDARALQFGPVQPGRRSSSARVRRSGVKPCSVTRQVRSKASRIRSTGIRGRCAMCCARSGSELHQLDFHANWYSGRWQPLGDQHQLGDDIEQQWHQRRRYRQRHKFRHHHGTAFGIDKRRGIKLICV